MVPTIHIGHSKWMGPLTDAWGHERNAASTSEIHVFDWSISWLKKSNYLILSYKNQPLSYKARHIHHFQYKNAPTESLVPYRGLVSQALNGLNGPKYRQPSQLNDLYLFTKHLPMMEDKCVNLCYFSLNSIYTFISSADHTGFNYDVVSHRHPMSVILHHLVKQGHFTSVTLGNRLLKKAGSHIETEAVKVKNTCKLHSSPGECCWREAEESKNVSKQHL